MPTAEIKYVVQHVSCVESLHIAIMAIAKLQQQQISHQDVPCYGQAS